ncbi:uncharacterized protein B0P05DRAFT_245744 [Gilbertella persicaria]|uniref:uncharacterized protein n=1 Tax=Gilbertella persicaria TaxID=101096 RepID=UPI00221EC242|nr:uncharacterized protein B0P05DRAFT_245744 [Gilbertella persicaria]KAI8062321.1 hypothetical protein B0P05DRAFT_245744 [Gilbertella persicaria]
MNIKNSTSPLVRSNTSTPRSTKTASPPPTVKKTTRRLSAAVCDSPVSTTQKPVNSPPTRSASLALKSPRPNAAMRARAEHAKQQQEELERKKNTPPPGSSMSLKLKQRVNSGIDWDTIKKERRKTVAEQPNSQKK